MGGFKRDPEKHDAWRRRGVANYRERLRKAIEAGKREWSSLNPVNRKRKAKLNRDHFGEKAVWIRSLPCVCCGGRDRVEAAHAKSRGAGGTSEHLVPLQHVCHRYQHQTGILTFQRERGVDLMAEAERLHEEWIEREEAA